jgi:hypothetical protein
MGVKLHTMAGGAGRFQRWLERDGARRGWLRYWPGRHRAVWAGLLILWLSGLAVWHTGSIGPGLLLIGASSVAGAGLALYDRGRTRKKSAPSAGDVAAPVREASGPPATSEAAGVPRPDDDPGRYPLPPATRPKPSGQARLPPSPEQGARRKVVIRWELDEEGRLTATWHDASEERK